MLVVMKSMAAVLTTVNAPYSEKLDGEALAHCLKVASAAKNKPGHMSSFFGEVAPEAQKEFAAFYGIPAATLIDAAEAFASYSGESYPLIT
jgi:hypothetical protein